MRALQKYASGIGNVRICDVEIPEPGRGEVLIRVAVAAVCGTDIHIYHDRFRNSPPITLGHEFAGVVERIGSRVEGFAPGNRVVSENNPFACGVCRICSLGFPNMCPEKRAMGILSDGCFADYVKLPASLLHQVPDNVSLEEAALMEPVAVAVHSVSDRCGIIAGDKVAVFGPGAIGILAAQVARAEGSREVLLVGTSKDTARLDCARSLRIGVLNVEVEDLENKVMELTGGIGMDVVVEASGNNKAIRQGVNILRRNGRMAISGITGQSEIPLGWDMMVSKGLTLFFAYSSRKSNWEKGLRFLSDGSVKTGPLITHRYNLEEWETAFRQMESLKAIRAILMINR
jgi:L-iditol 2-dehydrogenase